MLETLQTIKSRFNDKLDRWGNNHFSGRDAACLAWIAFWLGIYVSRYSLTGAIVEGAATPVIAVIVGLFILFTARTPDATDRQ